MSKTLKDELRDLREENASSRKKLDLICELLSGDQLSAVDEAEDAILETEYFAAMAMLKYGETKPLRLFFKEHGDWVGRHAKKLVREQRKNNGCKATGLTEKV